MVIQKKHGIEYVDKTAQQRDGGGGQMLTWLTKGERGVGEMMILADKGGRGGMVPPIFG